MPSTPDSLTISAPGKTFLLGEYLALEGGPFVVAATDPRFRLLVTRGNPGLENIHPDSPAGRLYFEFSELFDSYHLKFEDPHAGEGGLGASSAQFLLVHALNIHLESGGKEDLAQVPIRALLGLYQRYAWQGQGRLPSGADLLAQMSGGVSVFDGRTNKIERLPWPFKNLSMTLIRTGRKLATHEHLKAPLEIPVARLRPIAEASIQALKTGDETSFVAAVKAYGEALSESGYVAASTAALLKEFLLRDDVFAAKGCGAMGADIILLLHQKAKAASIGEFLKKRGHLVCGTEKDLSTGLKVETPRT